MSAAFSIISLEFLNQRQILASDFFFFFKEICFSTPNLILIMNEYSKTYRKYSSGAVPLFSPFWTFGLKSWVNFPPSLCEPYFTLIRVFLRGAMDTTAIMKSKHGVFTLKGGNSDEIVTLVQC